MDEYYWQKEEHRQKEFEEAKNELLKRILKLEKTNEELQSDHESLLKKCDKLDSEIYEI